MFLFSQRAALYSVSDEESRETKQRNFELVASVSRNNSILDFSLSATALCLVMNAPAKHHNVNIMIVHILAC